MRSAGIDFRRRNDRRQILTSKVGPSVEDNINRDVTGHERVYLPFMQCQIHPFISKGTIYTFLYCIQQI